MAATSLQFPVKPGDMLDKNYIGHEGISLLEQGGIPVKQVEHAYAGIDFQEHYRHTTFVMPDNSMAKVSVLYLMRDAFW